MTNDEHKSMGDEEYQYPNEEYVTETTPVEEKPVPPKQSNFLVRLMQNNKRITLVVAIVVVALIAFKLLSLHRAKVVTPVHPVIAQQTLPPPPAVSTPSPQVVDELSTLKQAAQNNQYNIGQLQSQVQDLHNSVTQGTAAQAQLSQSVMALTEQVKQLQEMVANMTQKPRLAKKVAPTTPPIVFHLRAVVPGRAWIVSSDGLSESVAKGDSIPQYGTVQVVDANRGMVLTSSGKVISYGENDH